MAKVLGITQDSVSRLENAAICCCRGCGKVSRRWAGSSPWSRSSPTGRTWCCRASLKKRIPRRNRAAESSEPTPERNERREGLSERVELGYGLELSVRLEERRWPPIVRKVRQSEASFGHLR